MVEFLFPIAFTLLLLPFVIPFLPFQYESQKSALHFSDLNRLQSADLSKESRKPILKASLFTKVLVYVVYALLVTALAKPVLVGEPVEKEESLREILICVDLSASMEARDFRLANGKLGNRLQAQKEVLSSFIKQLKNENFALIFYGSAAFVQSPFSNDANATLQLLNEAQIGMAGPKTVIGDALGLSIKLFDESDVKERLVILMSDGSDAGSRVPPLKAAELAKKHNIKVESIAVGDPKAKGEAKVDVTTLKRIAKITGGDFYFAANTKSLDNIYKEIDKLHPKKVKVHSFRPTTELFMYPVLAAVSLLLLYTFLLLLSTAVRGRDV